MVSIFANFMSGNVFYILLINFIMICALFVICRKDIAGHFGKISKYAWIAFVIILILGSYLRFTSPGCSNGTGLCFGYVETSVDMLKTQHVSDLWHPKAYSLLMAIGFFFFGVDYSVVYFYNLIISSLTIFLVFLLAYALFRREDVALFSSLIYSLFPVSIIYAKLNASEVTATFFLTLSVLIYLISMNVNKQKLYVLFFLLVVFSIQTRTDSSTFIPLFITGFILNRKKIKLRELGIPLVIFLAFMIPASYYYMASDDIYGPSRDPHYEERSYTASLAYMVPNIQYYISNNLTEPSSYPTILYVFLFLSLFYIPKERGVLYLATLAAGFFLFYGAWWMTIYNDTKIYQLALQPMLAILMGYGIYRAKELIEKFSGRFLPKMTHKVKYAGIVVTLLLIVLVFHAYANVFSLKSNSGNCPVEDILYIGGHVGNDDCLLVENIRSNFAVQSKPVDIMKILLPGKRIATAAHLPECGNMEMYYLYVNQTACPHSFFGPEKPLLKILDNEYTLKPVEKRRCVTLYKIEGGK